MNLPETAWINKPSKHKSQHMRLKKKKKERKITQEATNPNDLKCRLSKGALYFGEFNLLETSISCEKDVKANL